MSPSMRCNAVRADFNPTERAWSSPVEVSCDLAYTGCMANRPTAPRTACVRKDSLPASRPASRETIVVQCAVDGVAEFRHSPRTSDHAREALLRIHKDVPLKCPRYSACLTGADETFSATSAETWTSISLGQGCRRCLQQQLASRQRRECSMLSGIWGLASTENGIGRQWRACNGKVHGQLFL